jgi:hypothetical protein
MIELISLIGGCISSTVPYIFKYFQDRNDKAHELSVMQLQIQNNKEAGAQKLEEIAAYTEMQEFEVRNNNMFKGSKITDIANAGVPAVYAYTFLLMYVMIQVIYAWILKDSSPAVFSDLMWTEVDQSFMNWIMTHYFGKQAIKKVMGY